MWLLTYFDVIIGSISVINEGLMYLPIQGSSQSLSGSGVVPTVPRVWMGMQMVDGRCGHSYACIHSRTLSLMHQCWPHQTVYQHTHNYLHIYTYGIQPPPSGIGARICLPGPKTEVVDTQYAPLPWPCNRHLCSNWNTYRWLVLFYK